MPLVDFSLGTATDKPLVSAAPWVWRAYNIRVRAGAVETLGLFGPLRDVDGNQLELTVGSSAYRRVFTTPSIDTGQILFASADAIELAEYDATSTPATGTRWLLHDVSPSSLPAVSDEITVPSAARVEIPPVWWFEDQEDLVVGQRADVGIDVPHVWNRNPLNTFEPITPSRHPNDPNWPSPPDVGDAPDPAPTPVPTGACAGGIMNRILVLLGASSFTDPDPMRQMTVRWSDRSDFGQWTPSDITISGEMQLDGGSRIVGGGVTGFGVMVWTDKRMALLTETFDPNSVFSRSYIDGGRGMLANQAWCEADGQIFWMDESRSLNVFDGGRPRQLINDNRYASIERLSNAQSARLYIEPNQEYGEIIIHYPSGDSTEITAQLVYNYLFNCWYPWVLGRSGWCQRYGVIPNIGVDTAGRVWQHDLDVGLADLWTLEAAPSSRDLTTDDVEPVDFSIETNLVVQASPNYTAWHSTRALIDHVAAPADGAIDGFSVSVIGYAEPTVNSEKYTETQNYEMAQPYADFRVAGKAIQLKLEGTGIKTVFRFGQIDISAAAEGER